MRDRGKWRRLVGWQTLTLSVAMLGVGTGAFFLGRNGALSQANARQPGPAPAAQPAPPPMPEPPMSGSYTKNVVAYIYGTVPITREDLGEYLIARCGVERLEPFVNNRIIQYHCQRQGIGVTMGEIEGDLADTIANLKTTREVFEKQILKTRGKTLYEWKEDVIRPKLLMQKLCRDRVRVEEEDVRKGYEAYHGEKVKVQMICWSKGQKQFADKMWGQIRKDENAFNKAAREQESVELARVGGMIQPFGRHTTGTPQLEKVAFEQLEVGDVSPIIETDQGFVVIKLLQRIPPDKSVPLESVRAKLEQEIIEKKVAIEIPIAFDELKKQAEPKLLLRKIQTMAELDRDVKQELETSGTRIPQPEPVSNVPPLLPMPQK